MYPGGYLKEVKLKARFYFLKNFIWNMWGGRWRWRYIFLPLGHSWNAYDTWGWPKPKVDILGFNPGLSHGWQEPNDLSQHLLFFRVYVSQKLDGKQSGKLNLGATWWNMGIPVVCIRWANCLLYFSLKAWAD